MSSRWQEVINNDGHFIILRVCMKHFIILLGISEFSFLKKKSTDQDRNSVSFEKNHGETLHVMNKEKIK